MESSDLSRRRFLRALPASLGALLVAVPGARARPGPLHDTLHDTLHRTGRPSDDDRPGRRPGGGRPDAHPEPRPGIDGSKVLTAEQLHHHGAEPSVTPIYDGVREFAHLADGVRCYCGCADMPGYRSLLTCYEGEGMAMHCPICQGQGELLVGRAREGQSLDRIRRAIDARWKHLEPNR